ncbi:MAG: hypothetical protein Q8R55_01405 [Candidatus Taylorbacteria bacterium]|nr:hypothetical protein [Candidatus Taylorbacteria bacterium]
MLQKFWDWYKENIRFNHILVAVLFGWQLLHLYWLTTNVIAGKLLGYPIFDPDEFYQLLLIFADYAEIPALVGGTLLYFHALKEGSIKKSIIFIILINSQWLHLFWITDEFVISHFRGEHPYIPFWLVWTAILIDYLELPVIYDTIKNIVTNFFRNKLNKLKDPAL